MPDALITIREDFVVHTTTHKNVVDFEKLLDDLVRKGLVKRITVKGKFVYGRHYLSTPSIRRAYHKEIELRRRRRSV